ncbi:hypothetical protein ACFWAA_33505 [Streptomyces sp. NPDC059922]|uniref:hypothetical protein n=1 Tax=Streptomyces sp. NPDC059922 TaxID=3347005 RepID=UPI00365D5204
MATVIPGALADHLTYQFISDDETAAALDAARRGRGRTLIIEPTSTRVLHVISRAAERILELPRAYTRAQRDAAHLWIARAGHAPALMVHRFDSTEEAYNRTQCGADIRDGDVLVIASESVVGFLRSAWPAAITEAHGELHTIQGDPRTLDDGRYTASVEAAEKIAGEHGFTLAEQQLAAVEDAPTICPESVTLDPDDLIADEWRTAATLVTEAEATEGTWRGEWIGEQADDDALFPVARPADQGALFDHRVTEPAAVDTVAPEVTRASVDAYLAREYPLLFAPKQPQPPALPPVQMWAVTHRVVIRGEWQGLIMCGLGRREAHDRASVLRYTGSKAVEVVPCEHGPHSHRDAQLAARCEGCGYQIPTGTEWHDACRPRPRPTPRDRALTAAEINAGFDRALDASAAVTDLDGEPPF